MLSSFFKNFIFPESLKFNYSVPLSVWASLIAQSVKNLPARQETQVQFLGQEDPLAKGIATHYSILAWRNPWTEDPGRLQSMELQRSHKELDTTE